MAHEPDSAPKQHRAHGPRSVRVFVVTVSDSRTEADDTSGRAARELCAAAGHEVVGGRIVRDEPQVVAALVAELLDGGTVDCVITNGGTGVSPRDSTYEAVVGLLHKRLDGFGELFRALSYQEIGSAAMASRAVGGTRGRGLLFALPGSTAAVRLGLEKLVLPELGHLVGQLRRSG
jgi:molybdopterin adenylyltransferase